MTCEFCSLFSEDSKIRAVEREELDLKIRPDAALDFLVVCQSDSGITNDVESSVAIPLLLDAFLPPNIMTH